MKPIFLIIICAILIGFSACEKEKEQTSKMVFGRIVDSNSHALANEEFVLYVWVVATGLMSKNRQIPYPFKTNNEGNFNIEFKDEKYSYIMMTYGGNSPWVPPFWSNGNEFEHELNAGVIVAR